MKSLAFKLAAPVVFALAVPAQSATLWDNGPITFSGAFGPSNYECAGCTDQSSGLTVYDDFELSSAADVDGFTHVARIFPNPGFFPGEFLSTRYTVWQADPRLTFAQGPLATRTVVGTTDNVNGILVRVSGNATPLRLSAGRYWLGIQNNMASFGTSAMAFSATSQLDTAFQGSRTGDFSRNPSFPDVVFSVQGTLAPVPEPRLWSMLIVGFAATGFGLRRRNSNVLAKAG